MTTWPLQKDCTKFYGNPRGSGGKANPKWEAENLVLVKCPWTLRFEGKFVSGIRIHKKCADSLRRVLAAIWEACGRSQAEIDRIGMSKYGGSYNFRSMRGSNSLSMHSYGIAVDFDPSRNGLGDATPAMDHRVVRAFEAEGWEWGGHWSRPDGMHFQAARTRAQPKRLPVSPGLTRDEIRPLQKRLRDLGYFEVGLVDGIVGKNTRSGIRNFQEEHGLPVTEAFDDATIKRLATAGHRQATTDSDRSTLTAKDLSKAGDQVVKGAETVKTASIVAGGSAAVIGVAEKIGEATGMLSPLTSLLSDVPGWIWALLAVGVAVALWKTAAKVERTRLKAVRLGEDAGPA